MLRDYQQAALDAIVDNYKAGIRKQLLVLATGLGKTVIAAQLPERLKEILPGKMLFIAHREELIKQARDKIVEYNPHLKVGIEKAESRADLDCDVIIACNATIGRSGSERMKKFWEHISTIVIDECHHSIADSYMNILTEAGVLEKTNQRLLLGLTATPKRHNRQTEDGDLVSLKKVFDKIVFSYPIRKGIKDGWLSHLRGFRVSTTTNLDDVKKVAGDFKQDELAITVNTQTRNAGIVKAWKEHAENRPTLCFTVDVQHAKDVADEFLRAGVLAQPIWGDDKLRPDKLRMYATGAATVLCNCALLTEGFDAPHTKCIIMARPTQSSTLYTQMVGRGTRIAPDKLDCIVLDMVDNYKKCSLVTLPTLCGLDPAMNLHGESLVVAAETLESLQEQYPSVNFKGLKDIADVKQYIESIDLFSNPYPEEVKEYSKLAWMASQDGSFVLSIPEKKELRDQMKQDKTVTQQFLHEKLHIIPNDLDEYELSITSVSQERKLGEFKTLKEAFEIADDVIRRCRGERMKVMTREAPWHDRPASDPQKQYIRKLIWGWGKKKLVWCVCKDAPEPVGGLCPKCKLRTGLTSGQAQLAINLLKARRG